MHKKQLFIGLFAIVVVLLSAISCAPPPKTVTAPAQVQPTAGQAATPASNPLTPASQDAWAQIESAARKEGKLTLYTWGVTGQAAAKMGRAFKVAYGIEIETVTGIIPTLIERLKTEQAAGKYIADTFDASSSSLLIVKDAGLSQPIGNLPALARKSDFKENPLIEPDGHLMTVSPSYRSILVNTNLVKPSDEPKSYQDLLDPKWKGKIVLPSPVNAVGLNTLYALKEKFGLDDEYFRKLAKNDPVIVATDREAADMVIRGEAYLAPNTTSSQASSAAAKGAPVKGIFPVEGATVQFGNTWSFIKNAPHPNAARVFLNWLLLSEGQKTYSEAMSWTPLRNDLPDYVPAPLQMPKGFKSVVSDLPTEIRVADLRKEKTVAKLMGIEK